MTTLQEEKYRIMIAGPTSSKLLAKGVFEKEGKVHIIAVFERSDFYHFFFHFTARSKRSPRKTWKFDWQYYMVSGGFPTKPYKSIDEFIQDHYNVSDFKIRYSIRVRSYKVFHERIAFPFKNYVRSMPLPGQTFDYANGITTGKRKSIAYRR